VRIVAARAKAHGIEPAALLAIVECETNGDYLESDGRTPKLLYERHVAYREAKLRSTSLLAAFVKKGLAIPKWNRATQYKDQGKSKDRLALIAVARSVDEEVANRSASWGLGQVMGFNHRLIGFPTATALVSHLVDGGFEAQLDTMISTVISKQLVGPLNDHDFVTVARRYNGAGFAQNQYDTRMAASWRKWSRSLDRVLAAGEPAPEQALTKAQVKAVQSKLIGLGYKIVGKADGKWGTNTTAGMAAFQKNEGLIVNGHFDDPSRAAFNTAIPKPIDQSRLNATVDDLRPNSRTIQAADKASTLGTIKKWAGGALGVSAASQQLGLLDTAQSAVDQAGQAKSIFETVHEWVSPFLSSPIIIAFSVFLVVAGFLIVRYADAIKFARLDDHHTEANTGNDT
jgi:peptidoglycan hydrolase-like protein with peptidoglycan-binding domain